MGEVRHALRAPFAALLVALLGCGGKSLVSDASDGCEPLCDAKGGTSATGGVSTGGVSMTGGAGVGGSATGGSIIGGASTGGGSSRLGRPCEGYADMGTLKRLSAIDIDRTLDEVLGPGPTLQGSWPRTRVEARSPNQPAVEAKIDTAVGETYTLELRTETTRVKAQPARPVRRQRVLRPERQARQLHR